MTPPQGLCTYHSLSYFLATTSLCSFHSSKVTSERPSLPVLIKIASPGILCLLTLLHVPRCPFHMVYFIHMYISSSVCCLFLSLECSPHKGRDICLFSSLGYLELPSLANTNTGHPVKLYFVCKQTICAIFRTEVYYCPSILIKLLI